jgi:hypothetical protein
MLFNSSITCTGRILLKAFKDDTTGQFNLRSNNDQMTKNIIRLDLNSKQNKWSTEKNIFKIEKEN